MTEATAVPAAAPVHPFITMYRRGTTERITSLDPLSKEFIDSISIPKSRTRTDVVGGRPIPIEFFTAILKAPLSRLSSQIPRINELRSTALGAAGRPWGKEGFLTPTFNISSTIIFDPGTDRVHGHSRARVLMDFWIRREPEFQPGARIGIHPIKVTLVNKFEALSDRLHCYSFIVEGPLSNVSNYVPDMSLVHVWVNKTYLDEGRRSLPMYFEHGGALTLATNLAISSLGLRMDACGSVVLEVHFEDSVWERELTAGQIEWIKGSGALPIVYGAADAYFVTQLHNANLSSFGYVMGTGGRLWTMPAQVKASTWQMRLMAPVLGATGLNRAFNNSIDYAGVSKKREQHPELESSIVSGVVARNFWRAAAEAESPLVPLIQSLKREVISRSVIKQAREVDPGLSATELVQLFQSRSMDLGRFDFERNLPRDQSKAVEAKATES